MPMQVRTDQAKRKADREAAICKPSPQFPSERVVYNEGVAVRTETFCQGLVPGTRPALKPGAVA